MLDENDHRSLGKSLNLFHFQEEAPGMVFWHPRGFALYQRLENAVRKVMQDDGFLEVRTPQLLRQPIWEASGHWGNFAEGMFVLDEDERKAALKPVNCPGHIQIVERMAPSYRDLPLRIGEFGTVHRSEPSGVLLGLFRLRQFTQDDGHILCKEEHIEAEVERFCRSLRRFYEGFEFEDIAVGFSTRPEKRAGSDEVWDRAEAVLASAAKNAGLSFQHQPGQGAFYGPKLEFVLRDRLGRHWQCGTIQLDLVLPARFDLRYVEAGGARLYPAMLHRALLGSLERFLGILLEHFGGALPAWLSPDQILIAPVAGEHHGYAERVAERLHGAGLRALVDQRSETLSRKIADAHASKIPFVLVVGQKESELSAVTIRNRQGGQKRLGLEEAVRELVMQCKPPS